MRIDLSLTSQGKISAVLGGLDFGLTPRAIERMSRGENAVAFSGFSDRALVAVLRPEWRGPDINYRAQICEINLVVNGRRVSVVGIEGGILQRLKRSFYVHGAGMPYRISKGNLVILTSTGKQLTIRPSDIEPTVSPYIPTHSRVKEEWRSCGSGPCVCVVALDGAAALASCSLSPISCVAFLQQPATRPLLDSYRIHHLEGEIFIQNAGLD